MEIHHLLFFLFYFLQGLEGAPPVEVTPQSVILLEHTSIEVKCKVNVPISYCRFSIPGVMPLNLRPLLPPHEGIQYAGSGLEKGECGVLIRNVSAKHSGTIQCSMGFPNEPTESAGNMTLIVALPPAPPTLLVAPGQTDRDSFREGETIHATCRINNARPIANISWFLGSVPIYDRLSRVVTEEEENGLSSISQNLSRVVSYTDHGKDLKCVAGHIALGPGNINHSIHKLNIRFPPKPKSQELEKFGFTIGQPGRIVVTFQANPIPDILWKVDQDNLKQGTRDRTGRFEAKLLQHKGAATWDAILNINTVRPEEVEKRYTLIAQNELGQESYKVAISTSPEPPSNITAGAIVGIVIAVLVILLLVFIAIFARATGKWCFAEHYRSRSNDKARGDKPESGVPRPVGESRTSPFRRSLHSVNGKNPVNSLVYKDYTLVETEDGARSYVSPEHKTRLVLGEKLKRIQNSVVEEKSYANGKKKDSESSSSSDSGYEVPISLEDGGKEKESSRGDMNPRKKSYPLSQEETGTEENGQINLPFYIETLEVSKPVSKTSKNYDKNRKREKDVKLEEGDRPWLTFGESDEQLPENKSKKNLWSRLNFWKSEIGGEDGKKKDDRWESKGFHPFGVIKKKGSSDFVNENSDFRETEVKTLMTETTDNDSLQNRKLKDGEKKSENRKEMEEENANTSKRFPKIKFSKLPWNRKKVEEEESESDEGVEGEKEETETNEERESNESDDEDVNSGKAEETINDDVFGSSSRFRIEPASERSLLNLLNSEMFSGLEEPEEVFPEKEPVAPKVSLLNYKILFDEEEKVKPETGHEEGTPPASELTYGQRLFRYPNLYLPQNLSKPRRQKNVGKIDPNPLKKIFGGKKFKAKLSISDEAKEEGGGKMEIAKNDENSSDLATNRYKSVGERGTWSWIYTPQVTKPETDAETDERSSREPGKSNLTGMTMEESALASGEPDGSDTESADHGSTDKSSMSKLTQEKQPKKLMNGLFGSFRKGKTKNKQADDEFGKNTFGYDASIKEQQPQTPQPNEANQVDGSRTEGIVYAELDMARSPGTVNVMRKDDEKTEYAEIIYPTSKGGSERTMNELRKSRENLAASRENLAEAEEAFPTTLTPEGKKEAAV